MASSIHSNPVYYSLASLSSRQNPSTRTVVLHKRPDHSGFGVYVGEDVPSGLYIVTVERNSPASDANIQPGDRVLAVNGQAVSSMATNPKDALIRAATNAQSLTLTIQSTNIFQTLDIPLQNSTNNNTNDNHTHYKRKHHSSGQRLNNSTDLESYIRSLFVGEDIQILPASNQNEYVLKSSSYPNSASSFHSLPVRTNHSGEPKKHHRSHRHHHHRRPKHAVLQTRETQTSINDDRDENLPHEQFETSPSRQQHLAYPNMGKSQLISRTQQQPATDNTVHNMHQPGFSANEELDFMPTPASPTMDHAPPSTRNQTAFSAQPVPAPSTAPNTLNRMPASDNNITHMADAVTAAMAASRKRDQPDSREQVVPRGQIVTSRAATTPPPSSVQQASNPVPTTRPSENSRESASAPKRISTPPQQARNTTPPQARNAPPQQTRNTTPPQPRNVPPPPYTSIDNNREPPQPADNQSSINQGTSNARNSLANPTVASVAGQNNVREVHLRRISDFQGFGFHLQYNKVYYLVQRIETGSPAENGGLVANDVILSINEQNTNTMAHVKFVDIVNSSSDVTFLVQNLDDYLRANPQRVRTQPTTSTVTAPTSNESEKPKSGLSKALGKLTSR